MGSNRATTGDGAPPFSPGHHAVAGGSHAWLQPDGGWGLSNAGVIVGDGESLLIDTLFDVPHTERMLSGLAGVVAEAPVSTVVNTHANGDHWFGNELLPDAEIVTTSLTAEEMRQIGPQQVNRLLSMPGVTGDYARSIFGRFDFTTVEPKYPTRTYEGESTVVVGGVEALLLDVGPAHTQSDTIVYCERDRVVYTGDIVFAGGTPIVWAGPFSNWVGACRRISDLDADWVVPGHGPVSPKSIVNTMIDYLEFVYAEASSRFDAGMQAQEAAIDIDLGAFAKLPESERLAVNVATVYGELNPSFVVPDKGPAQFGCMAELFNLHNAH